MKKLTIFLTIGFMTILFTACKKNDTTNQVTYPKQVSITYRVTSTAIDSVVLLTFTNETGGSATVNNPRLPFTKTISKTVNKYENISLGYFINPAKTIKMEILVDNQLVKSQENTSANAAMVYTFQ